MDDAVLKLKSYEAMVDVAKGNATKIICSTSNPSSLDTNPNGTLWLVYLEE